MYKIGHLISCLCLVAIVGCTELNDTSEVQDTSLSTIDIDKELKFIESVNIKSTAIASLFPKKKFTSEKYSFEFNKKRITKNWLKIKSNRDTNLHSCRIYGPCYE